MSYAYLFKYIIIGDTGVGKSCLLLRFTHDRFRSEYNSTFGVGLGAKIIALHHTPIKLRIWDAGGRAELRSIARSYSKDAIAILLVYDITRRETFYKVGSLLKDAREDGKAIACIMLVGNKCDLCRKRQVSKQEGEQFAKDNGLLFIETSSKTPHNVDQAFIQTASSIYDKIKDQPLQEPLQVELHGIKVEYGRIQEPSVTSWLKLENTFISSKVQQFLANSTYLNNPLDY